MSPVCFVTEVLSTLTTTNPCGDGGLAINATFKANGGGSGGTVLQWFSPGTGETFIADAADNRVRVLAPSTTLPSTPVNSTGAGTVGLRVIGGALTISSVTASTGAGGAAEFTAGTVTGCSTDGTTSNAVGTVCSIPVTFKPAYPGNRTAQLKVVTSAGTFYYGLNGTGTGPEAVLSPGTISSIAGTGVSGYNASTTASTAQLNGPGFSVLDSQGNLYFSDTNNHIVREITPVGVISTIAGTAGTACSSSTAACGDGGAATSATLSSPSGIALDAAGNLYISDTADNRVRKVAAGTGTINTFAGTGANSFSGDTGLATSATLYYPEGLAIDPAGNLYISDSANSAIRVVNANSLYIFTYAGTGGARCTSSTTACGDGGAATSATLNSPYDVAVDPAGNLLIADSGDARIRKVTASTGLISTVAGTGAAGSADGTPATSGTLTIPNGVAADAAGNIYIADPGNNTLRRVDFATGALTTLSNPSDASCTTTTPQPSCGDGGLSNAATFAGPVSVTAGGAGNFYVSDYTAAEIRKITVSTANLAYATTPINNTSTDSPKTEYLENVGNTALTLNAPSTGSNPSVSTGFTESNTQTCPQLSSNTGSLAAGAKCSYLINFAPTTVGTYTGSLVETDNSLNAAAATQTVGLTGTATEDNPTVALTTNPNPSTFGSPVTLTGTVTGNGTAPTGTVSFYSVGTTQLINLSAAPTSTTTSQTLSLQAGTYSISLPGTAGGGAYNGWNPAANPTTNNRWTDRYGIQLCASCATNQIVDDQGPGGTEPGFATDSAALAGYQSTPQSSIYPGGGEAGNPYLFTLTSPQSVTLSVPDPGSFGDDSGGLSLNLTQLTAIASGTVNSSDAATATTSALPVGTTPVIAVYNGDSNHVTAESAVVSQVVNRAGGANTDTLTSTNANPTYGSPITLTDTIPEFNGVCPTGPASFSYTTGGSTTPVTLGTGAIAAASPATTPATCVATLTTSGLPVGTESVTASFPQDANYAASTSNTLTETTGQTPGANDTLAAGPASSSFGSPVTLTFTVPTVAGASASPTGTVTFQNGATTLGTGTLSTTGTGASAVTTATLTTFALPVGTDTITATYPGDTNYAAANPAPTATETVNPATSAASLTASPASGATFGAPVTLTETVTPINGACPTSTVTFASGGATLGTATFPAAPTGTPATCTASITTTALPVGTDTVTATAPAAGSFGPISSQASEGVAVASGANDTLAASLASAAFGTPVTLTFTVPTVAGASAAPAGTVTFSNGSTTLGTGTLATTGTGASAVTTATLTTSALPVGTDTVTANYPGNANYGAANPAPTASVIVGQGTPSAVLSASPATGDTFGAPVVLTETVTPINGVCPTSSVTFASGGATLGTATFPASATGNPATCVATVSTTALPVGPDTITATAPAGGSFAAISSSTSETVATASGANDTLTANPANSSFGSPVQLTFTVPTVAGASAAPTGTVTFSNGSTTLGTGTLATSGTGASAVTTVTLTTSALPIGTDTVTATYPGNANYGAASPAPTATVTVAQGTASGSLSVSPATGDTFGSPVTLTETVTPINGVCPTATVTFMSGGATLGTSGFTATPATNPTACVATVTTSALPVGTDTITASAPAAGSFGAISSTTTEAIAAAPGSGDTLTANPTSSTFGSPVTLTFTVPTVAGAPMTPTGTVTFSNGSTTLGTAALTTTGTGATAVTTATLNTSALPVGTDAVTAAYPGNTNYGTGTATTTETVNQASSTGSLTASPATGDTFGSPVTLTETITPVNGVCPTSTVTFASGGATLGTSGFTATPATNPTACVATATTSGLPAGTDTITATAPAAGSFGAISSSTTEAVGAATVSGTLSVQTAPGGYGSPATLTETVLPVNGVCPTGTVTFSDGGTALGTGTFAPVPATGTPTSCVATATTTALPAGTSTVTASYPGNGTFAPITSTTSVTIGAAAGNGDTLSANPSSSTVGATVTLTFTVAPVAGIPTTPTGPVTFSYAGTTLGTGTVTTTNGVSTATLTTTALPIGTDTVTATYAGDGNYGAAAPTTVVNVISNDFKITATPPSQTVNAGDTTTYTVSLSGLTTPFNSPVTLTATGLPPGATVSFANPTYVPGAGPTSTTMTIATAPVQALLKRTPGSGPIDRVYYGLLLLPLLGLGKVRRKLRALPKGLSYCLAAMALLGGLGLMTGCNGGYFGPAPQTYTITVTGTSGTLVHSTTVTLTVR